MTGDEHKKGQNEEKRKGENKERKWKGKKGSVSVPMTLCKPDWFPYRVVKRSNKRTPLLAALLLVYKSLASKKKVAFRKPSAR